MPRVCFKDRDSASVGRLGYQYSDDLSWCHDGETGTQARLWRRVALQHLLRAWGDRPMAPTLNKRDRETHMSRIGKKPIPIPDKVKIDIKPDKVVVTGPK